jgi:glycosyltransferase involved in cell wall biosynthesis
MTKDPIAKPKNEWPLISIITATYNASAYLPKTIQSIRELNYKNIEWIIIDGKSNDNTVDLFRENEDIIKYWKSEFDNGIYDAWNKGLSHAGGEWIAFLGAGDAYKAEALDWYLELISRTSSVADFVSSKVQLVNRNGSLLREFGEKFDFTILRKFMNVAHVGALHHKSLFERFGYFDLSYKSSADYDFLMRSGKKITPLFLDRVTATMLQGGVSNSYGAIFETYIIQKKFSAGLVAKIRLGLSCFKRFIRPLLRGY